MQHDRALDPRGSSRPPCGRSFRTLLLAVTVALAGPTAARAQSGSWDKDANGNWSDPANWFGGSVPGGGGTATFGGAFSTGFLTANRTVTLDVPVTLGGLTFNNTADRFGYTISGTNPLTFTSGATLTFDSLGGSLGLNTIAAGVVLNGQLAIGGSGLGGLTISGPIADGTGSGSLLIN